MSKLSLSFALVAAATLGYAQSLIVSNDGTNVLKYNGNTGAFQSVFVPTGGNLLVPGGLTFGPDGNLYLGSVGNSRVLKYDGVTGANLGIFVPTGSGGLAAPAGIAFGPDGNLYVSSQGTSQVLKYDGATGAFLGVFVTAGSGGLAAPDGLTFGPDGNLYVNSQGSLQILKYDGKTGALIGTFVPAGSGGLVVPGGLTFGPDGNLYVTSIGNRMVLKYNGTTGASLGTFVTTGSGGLLGPTGLVFGPDGNLYVSSSASGRVLKYSGTTGASLGTFVTLGSGGLITPTYLAFSPDLSAASGKFQLRYFNTNYGSGKIILSNAGSLSKGGNVADDSSGTLCANVYAFDPNEEMQACCACPVTPNGLASFDIAEDIQGQNLIVNPAQAITVKILFTSKAAQAQGGSCDPRLPTSTNLAKGGLAWGINLRSVTFQGSPPATVSATTETAFSPAELSLAELSKLSTYCRYVKILGSSVSGICKSCQAGARGAIGQ